MTRKLNIALLVLACVIGLPYYWLLIDNRPGDALARPVSIEQLRSLAASIPGAAPTDVEVELVAFQKLPGNLFVAGSGLKRKLIGVMAFRLPVPGEMPIVIDSGLSPEGAREMGVQNFDSAAQARIDSALRDAGLILLTHEHADHEGGLLGLNDAELLDRVQFTAAQLPGNFWTRKMRWPAGARPVLRVRPGGPQAVAPGVVAIPAPSHTPGSQMIYVRLASGREVLFAGDISTFAQNWQELRARSRLIGDLLAKEDRGAVYGWLQTIRVLKSQAPKLAVIPGHDYEWFKYDNRFRGFTEHFQQ